MRNIAAEFDDWLATVGTTKPALMALVRWADADPVASPPTAATTLGFTSWDRDITYDIGDGDVVYVAGLGLSASKVQGNADGAVDSLEVKVLLNGSVVTAADITQGRWRGSTILLFLVNPEDLTMGRLDFHDGTLGQTTLERGQTTAEFLGLLQRYLSTLGETVTATCQNEFCGAVDSRGRGCGLDIATFTFTGAVTGWDGDLNVIDSADFTSYPNNQFNDGRLVFDDESWITFGIRFSIQADGIIELKMPPPFPVTPGMAFTVFEGCAKTREVCSVAPRDNMARYRGFPDLKGNDKLFQTGKR